MNVIASFLRLRKNEKRTAEYIKAYQRKRLNALLHHAWTNSVYYRNAFETAGLSEGDLDTCDVRALPVMDKSTLMENFDEVITTREFDQKFLREFDAAHETNEKLPGGFHIVHSSGSTGDEQFFLYDDKAWNEMLAGIVRGALWDMTIPEIIKLLAGGIRILYIAAVDGRYGGVMATCEGVSGLGGKYKTLDINKPLSEWQRTIEEYDPNVIIAYPTALKILAELVESEKVHCTLKHIITCGEPLSESLRNYIERVFGKRVINFYGASESLALGVESDPRDGMLLFDDMNLIECVDGELLVTCLYNFAQPIIRYRIHDRMELRDAHGKIPFTRAKGQLFRNEEVMWFENKEGHAEYIHPLAIEGFCVDGLLDYQFIREGSKKLIMLAQTSDKGNQDTIRAKMRELMGKILSEKHLQNIDFEIRFTNEIKPDTNTGKKRLVVANQKRKIEG